MVTLQIKTKEGATWETVKTNYRKNFLDFRHNNKRFKVYIKDLIDKGFVELGGLYVSLDGSLVEKASTSFDCLRVYASLFDLSDISVIEMLDSLSVENRALLKLSLNKLEKRLNSIFRSSDKDMIKDSYDRIFNLLKGEIRSVSCIDNGGLRPLENKKMKELVDSIQPLTLWSDELIKLLKKER